MVQAQAILDFCDRIAAEFHPEQVILFGSYAYGEPNEDSDVDVLVVVKRPPDGYRKAAEICDFGDPRFPIDMLVRTSAILRKRIAMSDFFMMEIVEKGIVPMMPMTQEWVYKAENDFNTAGRLLRARKLPDYDGVCFHAQQCAEKYMKARLQEATMAFPKTHDLVELLALIATLDPSLTILKPQLRVLTKAAVEIRYPGRNATKPDARDAFETCREVRRLVRMSLGLTA